jgi:hypothetical protein
MPALGDELLAVLEDGDAKALLGQIETVLGTAPPKAIERAAALYIWKREWERQLPASRHGGDRRSSAYREKDQSEKISFWSVASAATGIGERAIQLDIQLIVELGTDAVRTLWSSQIADNAAALKTVAALEPAHRTRLFAIWNDNPKLGFGAAMLAARLRAADDSDEAAFERLLDGWTRASTKARRRFLMHLGVDAQAAEAVLVVWRKRGAE